MDIFVNNETAELERVVLGIGIDKGAPRSINPMIRKHLKNNTFPTEATIRAEIKTFEDVLVQNGVEVLRPTNLPGVEQIFTRDIGFVIEDYFFVSNMKYASRKAEQAGIDYILEQLDPNKIIQTPDNVLVEGGDVIVWNDFVFVGITERTTQNAIPFIQNIFPKKQVIGYDMVVDPDNAETNILHLDCAFQPIGTDQAIIYLDGFQKPPAEILDIFSKDQLFEVSMHEKNLMFPNIFSISPTKIVMERGFERLNKGLSERGFEVFDVTYSETSKLSGLLRCSTLPLKRKAD